MTRLTRRSALRRTLLATAGAAVAQLGGIVPELALVGGVATPLLDPNVKVRGRELFGRELDEAVREATTRGGAAPFYTYLARTGFRGAPTESMAVSIDASDGAHVGSTVVMTFRDRQRTATARVVHHLGTTEMKTSMAVWNDHQPQLLTVFRAIDGVARVIGTITIGDDDIVVDDAETGRLVVPRHMPTSVARGKAGAFAAVPPTAPRSAEELCHEVCGWVVGAYCTLVCDYTFFVICTVVLLLTGLPGLACMLISFAVCFTTCFYVQSWACSTVCA
jgi:hypothetical protein